MKGTQVQEIIDRISRIRIDLSIQSGAGFEYEAPDSAGVAHQYRIEGVRSHDAYKDLVTHLVLWTWNLKDNIRGLFAVRRLDKGLVESAVDANLALRICADLRHGEEHGRDGSQGRKQGRSGLRPKLGQVRIEAPQGALQALIYEPPSSFTITIDKPDLVDYYAPVFAHDGSYVGDAVELSSEALDAWNVLLKRVGLVGHDAQL